MGLGIEDVVRALIIQEIIKMFSETVFGIQIFSKRTIKK